MIVGDIELLHRREGKGKVKGTEIQPFILPDLYKKPHIYHDRYDAR